ncbi:hypothetical protein [Oryza sativa Japonica Group]|uniref:Uncharacterized protein n=1 Tax=Oryza sativa subsp. japonica TaxID=39947 RepID=Q656V0_ORYSJ|nr:hypothetical protein [Oryza sativa Japonica Group]BAD45167.1 hypothetical protein [Oryza sativa Japonica Group]
MRNQWGLKPPNQFRKPWFESRGFWGGLALGFTRERERKEAEQEEDDDPARGPHVGARSARVHAAGSARPGLGWAAGPRGKE